MKQNHFSTHPFAFNCFKSAIKRTIISGGRWNNRISNLDLHLALKHTITATMLRKRRQVDGQNLSHSTNTFTSSDGHKIKLMIDPAKAAEGIIAWSCGNPLWAPPFRNHNKITEINGAFISSGYNKCLQESEASAKSGFSEKAALSKRSWPLCCNSNLQCLLCLRVDAKRKWALKSHPNKRWCCSSIKSSHLPIKVGMS